MGGEFIDKRLGLSIRVPKGAVSEGCNLKLEVGMCLRGPFLLPPDTTRISPILMVHPQENIHLQTPLEITLPHIIHKDEEIGIDDIQVIKADHQELKYSSVKKYIFKDVDPKESNLKMHTKGYVTFFLTHFCFVSLQTKLSRERAVAFGYCVCPLCPIPSQTFSGQFSYFLALTFFMEPCIEVRLQNLTAP